MTNRIAGRVKAILYTLPLLTAVIPQPAAAWSGFGHLAIANIAENDLRTNAPAVLTTLRTLITTDPNRTNVTADGKIHLQDVATWADAIRQLDTNNNGHDDGDNKVDHTTRIPIDGTAPDAHPCTDTDPNEPNANFTKQCADAAIVSYAAILKSATSTTAQKQEALRYIIHLVGDLHQPLHGSKPIGYDWVDVQGKNLRLPPTEDEEILASNPELYHNIHSLWDIEIIKAHRLKVTPYQTIGVFTADVEATPLPTSAVLYGTPYYWAQESSNLARDKIFQDDPGLAVPAACGSESCLVYQPLMLDANYLDRKWPIVAQRLKQAGLRLACVLEKALANVNRCAAS